ncbi:MAG TPA: hypothetical protein P5060_00960 [Candidatus Absconditabacterales bacterium]|nr:hypothetical protein [Candidatus Absconditabacterales bacterium]
MTDQNQSQDPQVQDNQNNQQDDSVFGGSDDIFENSEILQPIDENGEEIKKEENMEEAKVQEETKEYGIENIENPQEVENKEIKMDLDDIDKPQINTQEDVTETENIEPKQEYAQTDYEDFFDPFNEEDEKGASKPIVVEQENKPVVEEKEIDSTNDIGYINEDIREDKPIEETEKLEEKEEILEEEAVTEDINTEEEAPVQEEIEEDKIENIEIEEDSYKKGQEEEVESIENKEDDEVETKEEKEDEEEIKEDKIEEVEELKEDVINQELDQQEEKVEEENDEDEDDDEDEIEEDIEEDNEEEDKITKKFDELYTKAVDLSTLLKKENESGFDLLGGNDDRTKTTYKVSANNDNVKIEKIELDKESQKTQKNTLELSISNSFLHVKVNGEMLYSQLEDLNDNEKKTRQVIEKINKFIFLIDEEYKKIEKEKGEREKRGKMKGIFRNFVF